MVHIRAFRGRKQPEHFGAALLTFATAQAIPPKLSIDVAVVAMVAEVTEMDPSLREVSSARTFGVKVLFIAKVG